MGDCLGRIPYASAIGFIMLFVGAGIMCGTLYEASRKTALVFNENFYPLPELEYFKTGGICSSVLVVFIAIIILTFAVLTTGATRGKIYRGEKCLMGGRCSASFFLFLTYLLNIIWVLIACFLMVPVIAWIMLDKVCIEENEYWRKLEDSRDERKFTYTFNLTNYGFYNRLTDPRYKEHIDNPNVFNLFCSQVSTVGPLFLCSFGGAVLVIFGLVTFLASMSSNLVRLKYTQEITEYRNAAYDRQNNTDMLRLRPTAYPQAAYYPPSNYNASMSAYGQQGAPVSPGIVSAGGGGYASYSRGGPQPPSSSVI